MKYLPVGKLNIAHLEALLASVKVSDPRVVVGPRVGEDAAVIDFGDRYLIAKTDPITFTAERIGWYAVNINANDVAVMGATPKWFLATVLLPEGKTTRRLADEAFDDIRLACEELGVSLCGGHIEVTLGLPRPIVVGQMLGEVEKDKLVRNDRTEVGDDIVLIGGVAVEGTSVVAREKGDELRRIFGDDFVNRAKQFLTEPGISVVRAALLAAASAKVNAMHDPTEGGIATGLHELALASGTGMLVHRDMIFVYPETETICEHYGLDPLGVLASGALLMATSSQETPRLLAAMRKARFRCSVIGKAVPKREGIRIKSGERIRRLPRYDSDELTKIL
ncbi:MAG: AIR synthase family protein [bacterium]|jgi:hydrogenase maturation factor|nr:AIR synthase family protein [bacterium]